MYTDKRTTLHPHFHTVAILVYDEPGVLARIANLFMKKNFNIDTITVGSSSKEGISRITICFFGDDNAYEQTVKQLYKLIDVIKVSDLPAFDSVLREVALIKIKSDSVNLQNQIMNYCHSYRARIVNINPNEVIVEVIGKPEKINSFIQLVKTIGIKEIARTGTTGMYRGNNNFEELKKKDNQSD